MPDLGVHRDPDDDLYVPSAVMVVEILSPRDKTFEKFDFYFRHGVQEIMVGDLQQKSLRVWRAGGGGWAETDRSEVLSVPVADVTAAVDWP